MADGTTPFLSNRTYDALKWVAQIALPALGTLYFTISQIWHLAHALEIVGTISAVDIFLGALLSLSTRVYDGSEAQQRHLIRKVKKIRGGDALVEAAKEVRGGEAIAEAARELRGGYDGDIEVVETARDEKTFQMSLDTPPAELETKDDVLFKVKHVEE